MNNVPTAKPYNPTTFLERGVAVPFTTPLLGGARARLAQRKGVELILHNPAGGRGVYVMPWSGITSLCRPTLHDRLLSTRISMLKELTPLSVRDVARVTAAEGVAGERAMEAAQAAVETGRKDHKLTNSDLLLALIRQVYVSPPPPLEALKPDTPEMQTAARRACVTVAIQLGQQPNWTAGAINAIAEVMTGLGVDPDRQTARIPRLMGMVSDLSEAIAKWGATQHNVDRVSCCRMIGAAAELTLSLTEATLGEARALAADMVGLLRLWGTKRDSVVQLAARPEWLLDGWDRLCLVWHYARDDGARRAALIEIADHLPILPREAGEWCGQSTAPDNASAARQGVHLNEDWQTGGAVLDLVARGEQFRATML